MKRTPLKRRTPMPRPTKPMRESNPERQARRRKQTAKLRRSPEHRQAIAEARARSGGRCEYTETAVRKTPAKGWTEYVERCTEPATEMHHIRYSPPILLDVCRKHHELIEWELRPWNRGRLGR